MLLIEEWNIKEIFYAGDIHGFGAWNFGRREDLSVRLNKLSEILHCKILESFVGQQNYFQLNSRWDE